MFNITLSQGTLSLTPLHPFCLLLLFASVSDIHNAQSTCHELWALELSCASHLQEWTLLSVDEPPIWCDVSTAQPWPFLPAALRCTAFDTLCDLSHPGVRGSKSLHMRRHCQMVSRVHSVSGCQDPLACLCPVITVPHRPLPTSHDHSYILTVIGHLQGGLRLFCWWALQQRTAHTCSSWGWWRSSDITSDFWQQIMSMVWNHLASSLGVKLHHTTSYQVQVNGMVERMKPWTLNHESFTPRSSFCT